MKANKLWFLIPTLWYASIVHSAPTITGNQISWPDDGWYQVQNAATYEQACAGGRSCEVQPGTYYVINHTTQDRFTVVVESSGTPAEPGDDGVVVSGNTISWPNDGWYQVQNAATYEQACAGGTSCVVEAGTYIAINHTTGERFTNIVVASSTSTTPTPSVPSDSVTVTGNTISWSDDGWYQVQEVGTYREICTGGRSCETGPGAYIVINHTTGMRYNNIVVVGSGVEPEMPTDANPFVEPDVNGTTTVERLGYLNSRDQADDFVKTTDYLNFFWDDISHEARNLISAGSIGCSGGGSIDYGDMSSMFGYDVIFNECQNDDGYVFSGGLRHHIHTEITGGGSSFSVFYKFNEFVVDAGELGRLEVTGETSKTDSGYQSSYFWCNDSIGPTVSVKYEHHITSAQIETSQGITLINMANWKESTIRESKSVTSWSPGFEYPECIFVETLTFDGEASVVSPDFGPNEVIITKQGSITRNELDGSDSSSTATLSANFGDGSSLVVNATNDAESEVQVDIVSGAVAVSFTDSYRFEGLRP